MGLFSRFSPRTVAIFHTSFNQDIEVVEKNKKTSLRVNDIEQSGEYVDELFQVAFEKFTLPKTRAAREILIFGVGGGSVFRLLRSLYPNAQITGVDVDKKIIDIAENYFDLKEIKNCELIVSDARDFVTKKRKKRFDLVVVDIYVGNDVPAFVTEKQFLVDIKNILRPQGVVIMNYFSYHKQSKKSQILLDKLSQIYQSVRSLDILRNKFFYCS